jgi:hypothetical protein
VTTTTKAAPRAAKKATTPIKRATKTTKTTKAPIQDFSGISHDLLAEAAVKALEEGNERASAILVECEPLDIKALTPLPGLEIEVPSVEVFLEAPQYIKDEFQEPLIQDDVLAAFRHVCASYGVHVDQVTVTGRPESTWREQLSSRLGLRGIES